jgi:HSP20 family molecular chaperone IbpA
MATETTTDLQKQDERQSLEREGTRPGPVFRPDVDIVERQDEFVVTADLPGADGNTVQVRLEEGVLLLDADLATRPDADWTPVYAEYRPGGYHREFRLSDEIDPDRIQATMRDGVLELRLPKSERARPRQIKVQTH